MGWNAGTYTKGNSATGGWAGDASLGIGIEAGRHDTQDNDFETGINSCLTKDGTNSCTGNLNLGGYKPVNLASGTAAAPAICAGNDVNTGIFSAASDQIGISTNGTERVRIDSSGKVGINNTAPTYLLDIQTTDGVPVIARQFSNDTTAANIILTKSRAATVGTNTIVQSGDVVGTVAFQGANGSTYNNAGMISCVIDETPGATNDMPGRLVFSTTANGSATLTERMRIDNAGKIGIGTTSPTSSLSVAGPLDSNTTNAVHAGTISNYSAIELTNSTGGFLDFSTTSADAPGRVIYTHSDNKMKLQANTAVQMTLDGPNNRVGIGTESPSKKLHVYIASGETEARVESASIANTDSVALRAIGTVGVISRDARVFVYKHSGITNPAAAVGLDQENGTSAFIWADNSNVLRIGTSISSVGTTGGTVVGTQTSDERVKTVSSEPFPYGLTEVLQIAPVEYTFDDDSEQSPRIGFTAQQVQSIVPECVYDTRESIPGEPENAPTKLAMDYTSIIPVLVKALQELNAKVESLEARVAELES